MPIYEWWLRLINGLSQAPFTLCDSAVLLFTIASFATKWQDPTDAFWKDLLPNTCHALSVKSITSGSQDAEAGEVWDHT